MDDDQRTPEEIAGRITGLGQLPAPALAPEQIGGAGEVVNRMLSRFRGEPEGLQKAREKFEGTTQGLGVTLARHAASFGSAVSSFRQTNRYKEARDRLSAGKAEDEDYGVIAAYERQQQLDEGAGFAGQLGRGILGIPAVVGEGAVAGPIVGKALGAVGLGGEMAATGTVGMSTRELGRQAAGFGAKTALTTAAMPSMYLPEAAQRAAARPEPSHWSEFRNLAPAFGLGMANVAVLGSLQAEGGQGLGAYLKRVGVGMGEQQMVDLGAGMTGLSTDYGVLGDLLNGKQGDALKRATVQAVTFAAFAAMHGQDGKEVLKQHQETLAEAKKQGLSPEEAAAKAGQAFAQRAEALSKKIESDAAAFANDMLRKHGGKGMSAAEQEQAWKEMFDEDRNAAPVTPPGTEAPGDAPVPPAAPAAVETPPVGAGAPAGPEGAPNPPAQGPANQAPETSVPPAAGQPVAANGVAGNAGGAEAGTPPRPATPAAGQPVAATGTAVPASERRLLEDVRQRPPNEAPVDYAKRLLRELADPQFDMPVNQADLREAGIYQRDATKILDGLVASGYAKRDGSSYRLASPETRAAGDSVEASRRKLQAYGFSRDDLLAFEREASHLRAGEDWSHSLENLVQSFEAGTDESNPEIGNEQQMIRKHLETVVAARQSPAGAGGVLSPLERMRQRQAKFGALKPKGGQLEPPRGTGKGMVREEDNARVREDEIAEAMGQAAGETDPADEERKLTAAGLTEQERKVYWHVLAGWHYGTIGETAGAKGQEVTRARVGQIIDRAAKALGKKSADILDEARANRVARLEAGDQVRPDELHQDAEQDIILRKGTMDELHAATERVENQLLKEMHDGTLTPERQADYERQLADLAARSQTGPPKKKRKSGRGTGGPAQAEGAQGPVRPATADSPAAPTGPEPGAAGGVEPAGTPLPRGMGAAGGGGGSTPPPGTPGASVPPVPPGQQEPTKSSGRWFSRARDWLASFGQATYPTLTRNAADSANGLASVANAPAATHATWDYFSHKLKMGQTALADLGDAHDSEAGTTFLEWRAREYRDTLNAKAAEAAKNGDAEAAAEWKRRADAVVTFVGKPGSLLLTEEQYRDNHDAMFPFFEQFRTEWTPEVEKNYRDIKGLEPDEDINALSQIPGLPINAIPMKAEDVGKPGVVGVRRAKGFGGQRMNAPSFMRKAELNAEAYDTSLRRMMQRTLDTGIAAARRAEAVRQMLADGVIEKVGGTEPPPAGSYLGVSNGKYVTKTGEEPPAGWHHSLDDALPDGWAFLERDGKASEGSLYLNLRGKKQLKGIDPNAEYYVSGKKLGEDAKSVEREIVQGLGIGDRPGEAVGRTPFADAVYNLSLAGPQELAYHMANQTTALLEQGMGTPWGAAYRTLKTASELLRKDPDVLAKVKDLAEISASFEHRARPGLLGTRLPEYLRGKMEPHVGATAAKILGDPTAALNRLTSGMIDLMQKAVRVQLGEAYDRLSAEGLKPEGEQYKRDFINKALGNYNSQASNRVTQFLKDSGIQGFATAAHTFFAQGLRRAGAPVGLGVPTVPSTSWQASAQLRAAGILKLLPFLAVGPALNALRYGEAFPSGVPTFALKTSEEDDGQTVHYFDPLAFTGVRRGWRILGINALIEGIAAKAQGENVTRGQVEDLAGAQLGHSLTHLAAGPPAAVAYTGFTGKNLIGRQVAEKATHGDGQTEQNLIAAAKSANPAVSALSGAESPKKRPLTLGEELMQMAGPFGTRRGQSGRPKFGSRRGG